jgi:hypothetical protein
MELKEASCPDGGRYRFDMPGGILAGGENPGCKKGVTVLGWYSQIP